MTDANRRVHNRFKVPGAVAFVVLSVGLVIFGAVAGRPLDVAIGVVGGLYFGAVLWVVITGRGNPWWMRSPLDARRSENGSEAPDAES